MAISSEHKETLNMAISHAALKKIASKSPEDFVRQLKEQGIGSLEDLAKAMIGQAQSGSRLGSSLDDEFFGVCYKFTTFRPVFDPTQLNEVVNQINQLLH